MAIFNFRSDFFLLLKNDLFEPVRIRFEAGKQAVPDEYADHPFLHEMGERIVATPPAAAELADDRDALRIRAAALGIDVDHRWGVARLKAEIAAKAGEAK